MPTTHLAFIRTLFGLLILCISASAFAQGDNLALHKNAWGSTEDLPASNAVDGDTSTRWASAANTDPSYITVDLGESTALTSVAIHWEAANADQYEIQGSNNNSDWTTLATQSGGSFGDRTDQVNVSGHYRYVRIYGISRSQGNHWGYSIWQLEIYGQDGGEQCEPGAGSDNLALNRSAWGSTEDLPASNAVDGNSSTRWASAANTDPSYMTVDLGQSRPLGSVVIHWEAANAATYEIQGSNNNSDWTTLVSESGGEFGDRTDAVGVSGHYRYIRMFGTSRSPGNLWGYSIWAFEVYGEGDCGQPGSPQPVWSDEFNTIDSSNWTFETGGHGWGNYELQYYTAGDNAWIQHDADIDSNVLVLEARQGNPSNLQCWYGPCEYTSTRIKSLGKREFTYGRMEARIKLPQTQGIWPAFWMMGNNFHEVGWPYNGELDIMEHVGFEPTRTHGALHGPGYSGNTPLTGSHDLGVPVNSGYNVYAVEWSENRIDWYVNDVNFYSVTRAQVEQHGPWVYDRPFFFLFNVAVGGNWPGSPDGSSQFPQRMYIDYVRVYQ